MTQLKVSFNKILTTFTKFHFISSAATKAKNFLNNFNMYYSCNRLQIEFSWTTHLNVMRNDEKKAWDYTKHATDNDQAPAVYFTGVCDYNDNQFQTQQTDQFPLNISDYQPQVIFSPIPVLNEMNVILVDGMLEQPTLNTFKLFNLLSVFGNVSKIQFVHDRPGVALVQMFDRASAENCINYLNCAPIGDNGYLSVFWAPFSCYPSDYNQYQLKDGTSNFHDFSGSKNQRFLIPRPLYWIQPLSKIVRYYNTPSDTSEGFIYNTFQSRSIGPKNVKVLPPDEDTRLSRGLIEFHTVGRAVLGIMNCNNLEIKNGQNKHYLKLCFSSSQSLDLKH
jgi:hypothetical protein